MKDKELEKTMVDNFETKVMCDFQIDIGVVRSDYRTHCNRAKSKEDLALVERELVKFVMKVQDLIDDLKVQYKKYDKKEGK